MRNRSLAHRASQSRPRLRADWVLQTRLGSHRPAECRNNRAGRSVRGHIRREECVLVDRKSSARDGCQTVRVTTRFIYHDAIVNSGYFGAPICDANGHVIAVHLGSLAKQGVSGKKNCLAEPSADAIEFITRAVPNLPIKKGSDGSATKSLHDDLGEVSAEFEESIFQIVGMKIAPRLTWSHQLRGLHEQHNEMGWASYEDNTCLTCNGLGTIDCTARACSNGTRRETTTVTHTTPSGESISMNKPIRVRCDTCDGRGRVRCPDCGGRN